MRTDDPEAGRRPGPCRNPPGDEGAVADHVVPARCRVPVGRLVLLDEAGRRQPPGALGCRVVRRRRRLDEVRSDRRCDREQPWPHLTTRPARQRHVVSAAGQDRAHGWNDGLRPALRAGGGRAGRRPRRRAGGARPPGDRHRADRRPAGADQDRSRSRPDPDRPVAKRGGHGPRRGRAGSRRRGGRPIRRVRGPGRGRRRPGRGCGGVRRGGQGRRRAERRDRAGQGDRRRPRGDAEPVQGAVRRDPRPAGQGGRRPGRAPAQGHRAADVAGQGEPGQVQLPAHRGREGTRDDVGRASGAGQQRATDRRDPAPRDRRPGHRTPQTADPRVVGRDSAQAGGRAGRHVGPLRLRASAHDEGRRPDHATRHAGEPGRGQAPVRRLQGPAERLPRRRGDRGHRSLRPRRSPGTRRTSGPTSTSSPPSSTGRRRRRRSSSSCSCPARRSSPRRWTRSPTSTTTPRRETWCWRPRPP